MIVMVKKLPTAKFISRGKSEKKNTKENVPVERFGSYFSQNDPFNLISSPHCHIFTCVASLYLLLCDIPATPTTPTPTPTTPAPTTVRF